MARADSESMLGSNLPKDYVSNFWSKAIPSQSKVNKTEVVVAMANAWLELPDDVKKHYLYPTQDSINFEDYIGNIVEIKVREFLSSKTGSKQINSPANGLNPDEIFSRIEILSQRDSQFLARLRDHLGPLEKAAKKIVKDAQARTKGKRKTPAGNSSPRSA